MNIRNNKMIGRGIILTFLIGLFGFAGFSVTAAEAGLGWGGRPLSLNNAHYSMQNYFNSAGTLIPFFEPQTGEVGPGVEIPMSDNYIYAFNFSGNSIQMKWNTGEEWDIYEPYVGKVGGVTQEEAAAAPIADEYHITFDQSIAGFTAKADPTQKLVPNVTISDEYTLVISIPGGTTIGDGYNAKIFMIPPRPAAVEYSLQNYFNQGGTLIPFFDELNGEIGPGVEIPQDANYIYAFDFSRNKIEMEWNTGEEWDFFEPYVGKAGGITQEEAAALPIADEYHITFGKSIADYKVFADPKQSLVPNVEIVDDYTLVISIPGGTTIGDGFDAKIYLVPSRKRK